MSHSFRRAVTAAALASLATLGLVATPAYANNPSTQNGNHTQGCAVNWYAQSDLSTSYTKDYDGDGVISSSEQYSNQGYLSGVDPNPGLASSGPGDFSLQHWVNTGTSVGFRLPVATNDTLYNVTVRIKADSTNLQLLGDLTSLGLDKFHALDGPASYATLSPAPTVAFDQARGTYTLHWDTIPAGSANVFGWSGTALDGAAADPASHYLISATLTGSYGPGSDSCALLPAVPSAPTGGPCDLGLAGQTSWNIGTSDITTRTKVGTGGEINSDGYFNGATRNLRLYAATDVSLTNATLTFTAAAGFTFQAPTTWNVITASSRGMGMLYANGYTVAASGIGTPTVSADGKTLTLTVASMPAQSAVAVEVIAVPDGSNQTLVMNESMLGTKTDCQAPPTYDGCTFTQGYWKNHGDWPTGYSPSASFYKSGQTWQQVLNTPSSGGVYYQLATQYIAAKLSLASGATASPEVMQAIADAEAYFATSTPKTSLSKTQRATLIADAALLADFNNGTGQYGPAHCLV